MIARNSEDQRVKARAQEQSYYADASHKARRAERMAHAYYADLEASKGRVSGRRRVNTARGCPRRRSTLCVNARGSASSRTPTRRGHEWT